jgi:hypothetical protein
MNRPLESVRFFLGGKKCRKIVNIGVMRKDRAAQQRLFSGTILRGLTQPLNAYGYKYFSLSASADGLKYSDSIDTFGLVDKTSIYCFFRVPLKRLCHMSGCKFTPFLKANNKNRNNKNRTKYKYKNNNNRNKNIKQQEKEQQVQCSNKNKNLGTRTRTETET